MTIVFDHYSDALASYLAHGFSFQKGGQALRFNGLRDRQDLHDVLAETFCNAFNERARLSYNGLVPYQGYLRTIARNIVIDNLRSKGSRWEVLEEEPSAPQLEEGKTGQSPERAFERAELSSLMQSFFETLSSSDRRFAELRYGQGLSQQGVARELKRSRRWVRGLEIDVRKRLLEFIRDSGYLPGGAAEKASKRS